MTIKIRKSQVIQPFGVGSIIEGEGGSYVVKDISEWRVPDMEDISIPSLVEGIPSIRRIMSPKNDFELPVQRFPQWNFCPNPSCRRNCNNYIQWLKEISPYLMNLMPLS